MAIGLTAVLVLLGEAGDSREMEIESLKAEHQKLLASQQSVSAAIDTSVNTVQMFQNILGDTHAMPEYLKKIFQVANKKNLIFPAGNYRTSYDAVGGYESYVVELPIVGTYQKIRELSEEILLELPFSALEEMKFKRDSSSGDTLDVRLKFILYLQPKSAVVQ